MPELIAIDGSRFNDDGYIESRTAAVSVADRGSLRTALSYLYKDDGPVNLPRDRLMVAEPHLEVAERLVIRWLYTPDERQPSQYVWGWRSPRGTCQPVSL